jgi:ubiquinone/menaquinone biosynthesis C-methylase UbiE
MRESTVKQKLLKQAAVAEGHRVLDLGCGTGTLTLLVKRARPKAEVIGLDADTNALKIAREKASREGLQIRFGEAMAFQLPYTEGYFDRVLSSLLFHHLTRENKQRTLREVFRVLRPGGELHLLDWGEQRGLMRIAFLLEQMFDGFRTTTDNAHGLLPPMVHAAGFEEVHETSRHNTIFGSISLYRGYKPEI